MTYPNYCYVTAVLENVKYAPAEGSASQYVDGKSSHEDTLNMYSPPPSHGCFMPNERLRQAQKDVDKNFESLMENYRKISRLFDPPDPKRIASPNSKTSPHEELDNVVNEICKLDVNLISADVQNLRKHAHNVRTFQSLARAKETQTSRPVLNMIMDIVASAFPRNYKVQVLADAKAQRKFDQLPVSGSDTHPEPVLFVQGEDGNWYPTTASEAKSAKYAAMLCVPQAFAIGADSAILLFARGGTLDDCAVPVVLCCGNTVQIAGVYLIPVNKPVCGMLSPPMDLMVYDDFLKFVAWTEMLSTFSRETVERVGSKKKTRSVKKRNHAVELDLNGLFFKPVRVNPASASSKADTASVFSASSVSASVSASVSETISGKKQKTPPMPSAHMSSLNRMLHVYKKLWEYEPARKFILFPKGTTQLPSNKKSKEKQQFAKLIAKIIATIPHKRPGDLAPFTPLLVYPFLHDWTSGAPRKELFSSYMKVLTQAIIECTRAGIVFMDLRPANVMWKENTDKTVSIKLIDFEHVYTAGYAIDNDLVKAHAADESHRYNVARYKNKKNHYFASVKTNSFAVFQIGSFLREIFNDDDEHEKYTFGTFCKSLWLVQLYAPACQLLFPLAFSCEWI